MCLDLRHKSFEPYNQSKFRWKIVAKFKDEKYHEDYQLYRGNRYNPRGQWNEAQGNESNRETFGFHVYVTRKDARSEADSMRKCGILRVVKVEVEGFLASGHFDGIRAETWRRMKILEK